MSEGKHILIVDDDEALRVMLLEYLGEQAGFQCLAAATGEEALRLAREHYFDLVILDIDLPGMDGRETCRRLREGGFIPPVVMLTASDSDDATIQGLDAGATDYVTKPFKLGVLLARLRAHIRQFEQSDDAMLTIGPFAFQPASKTLARAGEPPIRLTDKEAQILKFLYHQRDRVVGREELLGEVWGYNAGVTTHTLETHVYRLRQKIEPEPSNAQLLQTAQGGYRLVP
ncbi:MAG: response regulator transcription factor [Alphaproteobacteria bacterium]|nr:response regulator transcription factor [Alphaproteobacteria bacterium]MBF0250302.1 response regulator transcription factor [Alphaproteobacteria bacterium]